MESREEKGSSLVVGEMEKERQGGKKGVLGHLGQGPLLEPVGHMETEILATTQGCLATWGLVKPVGLLDELQCPHAYETVGLH